MIENPILLFHEFYDVGGTTTMAAHLIHGLGRDKTVIMPSKKIQKPKYLGYGLFKQQIPPELISNMSNIFFMDLDDKIFEKIEGVLMLKPRDDITFVIHDTRYWNEKHPVANYIKQMFNSPNSKRWKMIAIRETIQQYHKLTYNIDSEYIPHPWYNWTLSLGNQTLVDDLSLKKGATAMTRLDFSKHVDIMFDANDQLPNGHENIIEVHGMNNSGIYAYHILKPERLKKYWKGKYDKSFDTVSDLLSGKKYLVNQTIFNGDGGGSEYSILEGIYHNCGLIINRKWITEACNTIGHSDFEEGYNCFAVDNANELADLLQRNPDTDDITQNARKLLAKHSDSKVFNKWAKYVKQ